MTRTTTISGILVATSVLLLGLGVGSLSIGLSRTPGPPRAAVLALRRPGRAAPRAERRHHSRFRVAPGAPEAPSPAALAAQRIKHLVFIVEENRSFDNLFGQFPGADGTRTATVALGGHIRTTPLVPQPADLWHDIGHNTSDALVSIDGGKMDGFSHVSYADLAGDKAAYQQLGPHDLPQLYAYAHAFTLADHTFASVAASSFPNHLHIVAARDGGTLGNPQSPTTAWGCDSPPGTSVQIQATGVTTATTFPCFTFATLGERLSQAHLSWTSYAAPPTDLGYIWSTLDAFKQIRQTAQWTQHVTDEHRFAADAQAGRLPQFSWVTPRAAESMHPPVPVCQGESWLVRQLNALMRGPDWGSTLVVVTWDDWGGYYDHVPPPRLGSVQAGIRVPLLVISPYARRGGVIHTVYTFESVLKTAEELWHLAPLTAQDRAATPLWDTLDLTQPPRPPLLLTPRACPPLPTGPQFRALLDRLIQGLLTRRLGVSLARLLALHRTQTLAHIAQARQVSPVALAAELKAVASGWAGGQLMLQLTTPTEAPRQIYLAAQAIDALLQAAPGRRLFPLALGTR